MATPPSKVKGRELEQAASDGNTDEILRLWLENGDTLDVEHKDGIGRTPLHMAACNGHGEACRALISTCGANVDSRDRAIVDRLETSGWTPLVYAAYRNKLQCVEVLLELGADISLRGGYEDRTAREWASERAVAAFLEAAERIPVIKSANKV